MGMVYICTKLHVRISTASLVITVKPRAKCRFKKSEVQERSCCKVKQI